MSCGLSTGGSKVWFLRYPPPACADTIEHCCLRILINMGSSHSKPGPTPTCSIDSQLGDCLSETVVASMLVTTAASSGASHTFGTAPASGLNVLMAHTLSDLSPTSTLTYHMPSVTAGARNHLDSSMYTTDLTGSTKKVATTHIFSTIVFTGQDEQETSTIINLPHSIRSYSERRPERERDVDAAPGAVNEPRPAGALPTSHKQSSDASSTFALDYLQVLVSVTQKFLHNVLGRL